MIDLRKAFDKTSYFGILNLLIHHKINPCIIKIIEHWFSIGTAHIVWVGTQSQKVKLTCGVRQGSILSPVLFSAYIDIILADLQASNIGCFLNMSK